MFRVEHDTGEILKNLLSAFQWNVKIAFINVNDVKVTFHRIRDNIRAMRYQPVEVPILFPAKMNVERGGNSENQIFIK